MCLKTALQSFKNINFVNLEFCIRTNLFHNLIWFKYLYTIKFGHHISPIMPISGANIRIPLKIFAAFYCR